MILPSALSVGQSASGASGGASYSAIGGGAAPFNPAWDFSSLRAAAARDSPALDACLQHAAHRRRRNRGVAAAAGDLSSPSSSFAAGQRQRRWRRPDALNLPSSTAFERLTTSLGLVNDAGGAAPPPPTGDRAGKLYCRTGFHLQIHNNGRVNGTRQDNSRFGVLEFLSIAFGLVSIRGKESNRYLCMNKHGNLYGSLLHTPECVFMERMLENYYNTYTSCKYSRRTRKWFVALNKRGRPRKGNRSKKKQRYSQFLVLHLDQDDDGGSAALRRHRRRRRRRPTPPPQLVGFWRRRPRRQNGRSVRTAAALTASPP